MPEEAAVETEATETPETRAAEVVRQSEALKPEDNTLLGAGDEGSDGFDEGDGDESGPSKEVPESYEFKVPEGMTLDAETVEKFTPIFKEAGLSQEMAQKLVDAYAPIAQKLVESNREAAIKDYENMSEGWKKESIKQFGADYKKALAPAAKIIEKTGFGKDVRELLEETRIGNHPTMVKFLVWVGKHMSEDSFVEPKQQSTVGGLTSIYDHPTSKATLK